jgi:hypothetical protein
MCVQNPLDARISEIIVKIPSRDRAYLVNKLGLGLGLGLILGWAVALSEKRSQETFQKSD